jgi:hypothetical protein
MHIMEARVYSIGQVATAVGVERTTLFAWTQRGHLHFLDQRRFGDPREFDRNDVAYTAAFALLAKASTGGDAAGAGRMMEAAIRPQPAYWLHAIDFAVRGGEVFILAKRYVYNGVAQIDCNRTSTRFRTGPRPVAERKIASPRLPQSGRSLWLSRSGQRLPKRYARFRL